MANSGNHHRFRKALGITLLALICIGGMELAVCRFAAPELFARVTAPVTALVQRAASGGARLTESLAGALHSQEEELLVDQKVSEPAEQDLPPAEDPAVTEFAVRNGQEADMAL